MDIPPPVPTITLPTLIRDTSRISLDSERISLSSKSKFFDSAEYFYGVKSDQSINRPHRSPVYHTQALKRVQKATVTSPLKH